MNRARPALAVAALLAVVAGCRGRTGTGGAPVGGSAGAQALIQAHKYDEAIAQVGAAADPESLYLLGLAWAGKAESAPLPTPGPGSAGAGEAWKPEELRALELLEPLSSPPSCGIVIAEAGAAVAGGATNVVVTVAPKVRMPECDVSSESVERCCCRANAAARGLARPCLARRWLSCGSGRGCRGAAALAMSRGRCGDVDLRRRMQRLPHGRSMPRRVAAWPQRPPHRVSPLLLHRRGCPPLHPHAS